MRMLRMRSHGFSSVASLLDDAINSFHGISTVRAVVLPSQEGRFTKVNVLRERDLSLVLQENLLNQICFFSELFLEMRDCVKLQEEVVFFQM